VPSPNKVPTPDQSAINAINPQSGCHTAHRGGVQPPEKTIKKHQKPENKYDPPTNSVTHRIRAGLEQKNENYALIKIWIFLTGKM